MSEVRWPSRVRPLTSKNYSFSRGANIKNYDLAGGIPQMARNATLDTPTFKLNFVVDNITYLGLNGLYNVNLGGGAYGFYMNLDSGDGIKEHYGYIIPNSWKVVRAHANGWSLSFDFICESLPSETTDILTPETIELYLVYGDTLIPVIDALEDLVENGLPNA